MRVALVVDNPFRDLPGLILVAARLAEQGASPFLVPMMRQDIEIRSLAPDAAVLNYLRPTNERLVAEYLSAGIHVSVLETEGGQLGDMTMFDRTLSDDRQLHSRLDTYFAWGARLAEHCTTAGWYRSDQVVVSGQPRFDFYAPRWRQAALAGSPFAAHIAAPMVLVTGNFPLSNPEFQSAEQEAKMMIEVFGGDPDAIRDWQRRQHEMMHALIDLVLRLARRRPDVTYVYRPHPFERAQTYLERFGSAPNIRLEKVGTVEGWILRAAAVVQRTSTTAIEAGMAEVPALTPLWLPSPDPAATVDDATIGCDNEDDLDAVLGDALAGRATMPDAARKELSGILRDWFHLVDGEAHDRVAARLLDRTQSMTRRDRVDACRTIGGGRQVRRLAKTFLHPRMVQMWRNRHHGFRGSSQKDFTIDDVSRVVLALGESVPAWRGGALISRRARRDVDYTSPVVGGRSIAIETRT